MYGCGGVLHNHATTGYTSTQNATMARPPGQEKKVVKSEAERSCRNRKGFFLVFVVDGAG